MSSSFIVMREEVFKVGFYRKQISINILRESSEKYQTLFVSAAKAALCNWRLELGGVGINDSEDRRIFSDLSQMPTILEHGFYVRASLASTETSKTRWVMNTEVRLKAHSPMHSKVDGLSASRN